MDDNLSSWKFREELIHRNEGKMEAEKPFEREAGDEFYDPTATASTTTTGGGMARAQISMTNPSLVPENQWQQGQQPVRQSSRRVSKPPQIYSPEPLTGAAHTTATATTTTTTTNPPSSQVVPKSAYKNFVRDMYNMLEEMNRNDPNMMRWTEKGKAFVIDPEHPKLDDVLFKFFHHRNFKSLMRQLNKYGFNRPRQGRYAKMIYNPLFYRGMNITQMEKFIAKKSTPRTTGAASSDEDGDEDDDDLLLHASYAFPEMVYKMLEETKDPDLLHWSKDGQAFYLNQNHARTPQLLFKYFKHDKYISFHRQLNAYGWTKLQRGKHQGMMYNPMFYRNMDSVNFGLITRKDHRNQTKKVTRKDKNKEKVKVKKAGATTAKKKKDKPIKMKTAVKSKGTKIVVPNKKVPPGGSKKRKIPPLPTASSVSKSPTIVKKKSIITDKGDKKATRRLTDYKKLHKLFGEWTMWNVPAKLDEYLENGKVEKVKKKKRKKTLFYAIEGDLEGHQYSDAEISTLLCNEDITDSISDNQNEEQALADLVERIRQDKEQKAKLQELWSKNFLVPIPKGKILPPSKFKKPTNKWRKLIVGNRVGVYWRDDELYYNASINKQQENTSYFHLIYDDDGAQEWLDLSREDFKIIKDFDKKSNAQTPGKDNRSISVQPKSITLPDNHSHLAPLLRYSWQGLGLGTKAGTPAYNAFVKERDTSANEVTALEILNDVRSIRNNGFSLPQKFEIDNNHSNNSGDSSQHMLMNQLRSLQDDISKDGKPSSSTDCNDTLSAIRLLTDNWSIPMVKENLRTMDTQIVKLNEREAAILKKCKQKGLC